MIDFPEIFMRCMNIILINEGGYVNNPSDLGGETKFGISKRSFPNEDIKNMTIGRAIELYYYNYWIPMDLAGINNAELVLQILDFGINTGIRTAIRLIQKIAGVEKDGIMGPVTRRAINNFSGDILLLYKYGRREHYRSLVKNNPQLNIFLKGWLKRIDKTKF